MLVLKMLMLKKDIYFHCGLSSRTSSKSTKKKDKRDLVRIYNNSNYKLT